MTSCLRLSSGSVISSLIIGWCFIDLIICRYVPCSLLFSYVGFDFGFIICKWEFKSCYCHFSSSFRKCVGYLTSFNAHMARNFAMIFLICFQYLLYVWGIFISFLVGYQADVVQECCLSEFLIMSSAICTAWSSAI